MITGSDYAKAYYNRGLAYYFPCQQQRAIQDYDKAIQLDRGLVGPYNYRGLAYHDLGQHQRDQRAIQDYDKAIQLDPDYATAYNYRSLAYYYLGEHTKAEADYARACSLDSQRC